MNTKHTTCDWQWYRDADCGHQNVELGSSSGAGQVCGKSCHWSAAAGPPGWRGGLTENKSETLCFSCSIGFGVSTA